MRVVMALKVRNEADIIEANLRHHLARGVDHFIVTDNGSDDGTREILRGYADAGLMQVIDEPHEDFWHRAHGWVTRMARVAADEHDADWVLHADADEFWMPAMGSLKEALEAVPDRYGVVLAPRPEFVARPAGPEPFYDRLTIRERYSRLRPKVAHRGSARVELHQGAHDVALTEGSPASIMRESRAVTRHPTAASMAGDASLAWAPYWPARVLHLPIRSFEQYRRRVETIVFRGNPPQTETRKRLRRAYNNDRLDRSYEKLVLDDAAVERGIADGSLVLDERLRDALRANPDPMPSPGEADPDPVPQTPEQIEADMAEIEYDAMQAITRNQRMLVRRLDRFQTESGQPKARVNPKAGTLPGRLLLRLRRSL